MKSFSELVSVQEFTFVIVFDFNYSFSFGWRIFLGDFRIISIYWTKIAKDHESSVGQFMRIINNFQHYLQL